MATQSEGAGPSTSYQPTMNQTENILPAMCWICYETIERPTTVKEARERAVHPIHACSCSLVSHVGCLTSWLDKLDSDEKRCPQCHVEIRLFAEASLLTRIFNTHYLLVIVASNLWESGVSLASNLARHALYGSALLYAFLGPAVFSHYFGESFGERVAHSAGFIILSWTYGELVGDLADSLDGIRNVLFPILAMLFFYFSPDGLFGSIRNAVSSFPPSPGTTMWLWPAGKFVWDRRWDRFLRRHLARIHPSGPWSYPSKTSPPLPPPPPAPTYAAESDLSRQSEGGRRNSLTRHVVSINRVPARAFRAPVLTPNPAYVPPASSSSVPPSTMGTNNAGIDPQLAVTLGIAPPPEPPFIYAYPSSGSGASIVPLADPSRPPTSSPSDEEGIVRSDGPALEPHTARLVGEVYSRRVIDAAPFVGWAIGRALSLGTRWLVGRKSLERVWPVIVLKWVMFGLDTAQSGTGKGTMLEMAQGGDEGQRGLLGLARPLRGSLSLSLDGNAIEPVWWHTLLGTLLFVILTDLIGLVHITSIILDHRYPHVATASGAGSAASGPAASLEGRSEEVSKGSSEVSSVAGRADGARLPNPFESLLAFASSSSSSASSTSTPSDAGTAARRPRTTHDSDS